MARFSILTPTRDRPEWLARAVASVQAQTFDDWQLVIYDNGIRVPFQLLARWGDDDRIHYFEGPAVGNADAFNRALELATGEIITPLSDDDRLTPGALELVDAAIRGNDHSWVTALTSFEDEEGVEKVRLGGPVDLAKLRRKYYLGGAVFWQRWLTDELGGFDTDFEQAADYDLYLRFAERTEFGGLMWQGGPSAGHIPVVLYRCTDHGQTDSNVKAEQQADATRRIKAKGAAAAAAK